MRKVLIDTSVWIEYFSGNSKADDIDMLIDEDRICINEIILCELIPFLKNRNQDELIDILNSVELYSIHINWADIINFQTKNVKQNLLRIGIPDLMIMQNALGNNLEIFSFDKHFSHLSELHGVRLYTSEN